MEKTNQNLLQKLTQILNVDKIISPDDVLAIRDALIGVLANNKKELESLTDETKQAVNSILDKVLTEHDTYLEKTKQIAQEAKSETTEAINSTLKSLEEVKSLCKEVMECKPENGEDADEEYVIGEVLNRIKLPEYKEIVLDDGGAIVDKINSLPVNEENQIDAKHIKNLPEGKGGRGRSGGVTRKIVEQMIAAAGGGSPGGSDTQVQFNDGGSFGGDAGLTYNKTTDSLTIGGGLTVDTNTLFVDATNNRVGIGTTSPLELVQIGAPTTGDKFLAFQTNNGSERGINYYLLDGTTIRGYMKWDTEEDLLLKGDTLKISTQNVTNPFHFGDGGGIGLFGIGTTAPTHSLTLNSTSTGIALYNTADQTTNYERGEMVWSANEWLIRAFKGGTGTQRNIKLISHGILTISGSASSSGDFIFNGSTSSAGAVNIATNSTFSATSGVNTELKLAPTISQSTTAGYTALLINPTETTTGSGTKLLADFQVGGSSKAKIDNTGVITTLATIELGNATDTTISRSSAGVIAVEGVVIPSISSTNTLTNKTISGASNTITNIPMSALTFTGCRVIQNATTTPAGAAVAFQAESFDTDTMHDNATNNTRITFTTAGKYMVGASITGANNVSHQAYIRLNGTTRIATDTGGNSGVTEGSTVSTIYDFAASDYIEVLATVGATSGDTATNFWAYRIG